MSGVGSTEPPRGGGAGFAGAGAQLSEVIPGDEDRGGDGAIDLDDDTPQENETDNQGGTGSDDGGPGSRNM
jgi:hypothetical protein